MTSEPEPFDSRLATFVHREYVQLAMLLAVAVVVFGITRALHAYVEARGADDEREWRRRGDAAMSRGDATAAIEAFQRATALDRNDAGVALDLAHALGATGDLGAARSVLLPWRDASPENAELNLALARLAAPRHDVTEAVRFYNYALYAPVAGDEDAARPLMRMELARFLVAHGQPARAVSELLLIAERPLSDATRLAAADLLVQAGDAAHGLEQYQAVERSNPKSAPAVLGAAEVLFSMGNYGAASTNFQRAATLGAAVGEDATIAAVVIASDPLSPRLPLAERRRRLIGTATYLLDRLNGCEGRNGPGDDQPLARLGALVRQLRGAPGDDDVAKASELVDDTVVWAAPRCAAVNARDQALLLIAARHAAHA